jgi:hypothetical protein
MAKDEGVKEAFHGGNSFFKTPLHQGVVAKDRREHTKYNLKLYFVESNLLWSYCQRGCGRRRHCPESRLANGATKRFESDVARLDAS